MKRMTILNKNDKCFYNLKGALKNKFIDDLYDKGLAYEDIKLSLKSYWIRNSLEEFLDTSNKKLLEIATNEDPIISCYNSITKFLVSISAAKAERLFILCVCKLAEIRKIKNILEPTDDELKAIMSDFGFSFGSYKELYNKALFGFSFIGGFHLFEEEGDECLPCIDQKEFKKSFKTMERTTFDNLLFFLSESNRKNIWDDVHGVKEKKLTRKYPFSYIEDHVSSYMTALYERLNSTEMIQGFRKDRQEMYSINYFYSPDIKSFIFIFNRRPQANGCLTTIAIKEDDCIKNIKQKLEKGCVFNIKETLVETFSGVSYQEYVGHMQQLNKTCAVNLDEYYIKDEESYIRQMTYREVTLPIGK